jgi:hypothetical protein
MKKSVGLLEEVLFIQVIVMELDKEFHGEKLIKLTSIIYLLLERLIFKIGYFRTILSNPIVTTLDTNERDDNVQSKMNLLFKRSGSSSSL